jgi:AP-1-like factor
MDFSQTYYGGAQPYQFMGISPLTPSQSNSAASEDYNASTNNNNANTNNQSPPEAYDGFPNPDQFSNFDQYAQYSHHQQPFQGPPGPPGPPTPPTHPLHNQNQPQISGHMNGTGPVKQRQQQPDLVPAPPSDPDLSRQAGSNSDDDDLTPAQSRRKAQNRAAQRAFRERKEQHVKNLEAKLASLEAAQTQASSENEKLKRDLQRMSTENEILRATSGQHPNGSMSPSGPTTTGPMHFNPTDFYSDLLANHTNKTPSHRIVQSEGGERLLAAGATWDLIINHELFRKGMVDVGDVSLRLKSQAKCDGQGPVFEERAVLRAVEESVASGSDELI